MDSIDLRSSGLNWSTIIIEEMGARLTPGKAVVKGGLELPELLQKPFDIRWGAALCW
jgi:hypothetical protein